MPPRHDPNDSSWPGWWFIDDLDDLDLQHMVQDRLEHVGAYEDGEPGQSEGERYAHPYDEQVW